MAQSFVHTVYKDAKWINEIEDGNELGGAHAATRRPPSQQAAHEHNATTPNM